MNFKAKFHSSEEELRHGSYSFYNLVSRNGKVLHKEDSKEHGKLPVAQIKPRCDGKHLTVSTTKYVIALATTKAFQVGKHLINKEHNCPLKFVMHTMKPKACNSLSHFVYFTPGRTPVTLEQQMNFHIVNNKKEVFKTVNVSTIRIKRENTENMKIEMVLNSALILRSNLLTLFSEILYASEGTLTLIEYSAFFKIYDSLRRRKLEMFEILNTLPKIKFLSLKQQMVFLMKRLRYYLPTYLIPSVNTSLNVFSTNKIESILSKGYLTNRSIFSKLDLKSMEEAILHFFKQRTMGAISKTFINSISLHIMKGDLRLSCNIFTGIMLNLPLETNIPEMHEAQLFFRDNLAYEENFCLHSISLIQIPLSEPYSLVHSVLQHIVENKSQVSLNLWECASIILPYLQLPYFYSGYHNVAIKRSSSLKQLLAQVVTGDEFAIDVIYSKEKLLVLENISAIDYTSSAQSFYYDSALEKLISKLEQLRRQESFSKYALRHVDILRPHLIFKAKQWFFPLEHHKTDNYFHLQLLLGSLCSPLLLSMNNMYQYLVTLLYTNRLETSRTFGSYNLLNNTLRDAASLILVRMKEKLHANTTHLGPMEKHITQYQCLYTVSNQKFTDHGTISPRMRKAIILDFSSSNFLSDVWFLLVSTALEELPKLVDIKSYWSIYYFLKYTFSSSLLLLNSSHLTPFRMLRKLIKHSLNLRMVQENPKLLHAVSYYYCLMNPGKNLLTSVPLTVLDIKVMLSYLEKNKNTNLHKLLANIASSCNPWFMVLPNSYFSKLLTIDTFFEIINIIEKNKWKVINFPCIIEKVKKLQSLPAGSVMAMQHLKLDNITYILENLPKLEYKNIYNLISKIITPENISKFNELNFNPMQYSTPTLHVYHFIVSMIRDKTVESNPSLLYALRFYKVYLEYELQLFVETVNFDSILSALPVNGDEGLQKVKRFLTFPRLSTILSPISRMTKFRTVHSLFQNIIKHMKDTGNVYLNNNFQIYSRVVCFCSKTYIPVPNMLLDIVSEAENLQMQGSEKWDIFYGFIIQPELLTIIGVSYNTLCNFESQRDMLFGIVEKALRAEHLQSDVLLIDALTHFKRSFINTTNYPIMHQHDNVSHISEVIHNLPIINQEKYCSLMTLYVKSKFDSSLTVNITHAHDQLSAREVFLKDLKHYYSLIVKEKHNIKLFPACKLSLLVHFIISELPAFSNPKVKQKLVNFLSSIYTSKILKDYNISWIVNSDANAELLIKKILQFHTDSQDINSNIIFEQRQIMDVKRLSSSVMLLAELIEVLIQASNGNKHLSNQAVCQLISSQNICTAPDAAFNLLNSSMEKLIHNTAIGSDIMQLNKNLWENIVGFQKPFDKDDFTLCQILPLQSAEKDFFDSLHKYLNSGCVILNNCVHKNIFLTSDLLQSSFYKHIISKCYLNNSTEVYNLTTVTEDKACKNNEKNCTQNSILKYENKIMEGNVDKGTMPINALNSSNHLNLSTCLSVGPILTSQETPDSGSSLLSYIPPLLKIKDIDYPSRIRMLLDDLHLDEVFGTSFNISQYYTPVLKLSAMIKHAKTINTLQKDEELQDALNEFEKMLERKYAEIANDKEGLKFNVNMYPNTTDEDKLWHVHRFFIQQPLSVIFGELFSSLSFSTEKDKLRAITEHVMSLSSVQFKVEWYEAFENFNRSLEKHQPSPPPPVPVTVLPDFARMSEKIPKVPNSDIHLPVFAAVLTYPNLMNILGSRFNVHDYPTPILKLWAIIKTYEESSMKFIYENVMGAIDKYKTALNNMIAKAPNKFILEEMSDVLEMTNDEKLLRITEFLMSNNTNHMIAIKTAYKASPKNRLQSLLEYVMFLDTTQLNPKVYYSLDSFLHLLDKNMDSFVPPIAILNFPDILDNFPYIPDDDEYFPVIVGLLTKPDIIQQTEGIPNATQLDFSPVKMEQAILNLKLQAMLKYAKSKVTSRNLIKCIEQYETALKEEIKNYHCT